MNNFADHTFSDVAFLIKISNANVNLDSQQWVFYLFTYFLFHSGAETQFQM